MLKNAHEKILKKVGNFLFEAGPGLLTGILIFYWAEAKYKSIAFHHRH